MITGQVINVDGGESLSVRKGAVGVKCSTRIHRGDEWAPTSVVGHRFVWPLNSAIG